MNRQHLPEVFSGMREFSFEEGRLALRPGKAAGPCHKPVVTAKFRVNLQSCQRGEGAEPAAVLQKVSWEKSGGEGHGLYGQMQSGRGQPVSTCELVLAAHARLQLWALVAVASDESFVAHLLTTGAGDKA